MATRDQAHGMTVLQAFAQGAKTANVTGTTVDTAGYEAVTFILSAATITDGTHTPVLQDSPDGTTWSNASTSAGAFTALTTGAGNGGTAVQWVGYEGGQRYVRLNVTVASASTGGVYDGIAILGAPHHAPTF